MARLRATVVTIAMLLAALPAVVPSAHAAEVASGRSVIGILSFDGDGPTRARAEALRGLGLDVQILRRLPLAVVRGAEGAIVAATAGGLAKRFHPDVPLQFDSAAANGATGAASVHAAGFTGEGVTVAVVDSGIDATHPELAGQVTHNVEILSPDQLPQETPLGDLVVAVDRGPDSNTDGHLGHGTMVAGVLAGVGRTDPALRGVAPDAEIVGYSIGQVLWMRSALAAYDHILDHPEWGIDVVTNSFAEVAWRMFDPEHPVHVATKALTDRGIATVFSAGNDGEGGMPMTLRTWALSPWVISAGASTLGGERADLSSNGVIDDNSAASAPVDGHVRSAGDRLGLYRPTVMAPGQAIESSCSTTGVYHGTFNGCADGRVTTDGTSFSAPFVAGLVALLRQARPGLTPAQTKTVLEATARPTVPATPLWQSGFGVVEADAALDLVQRPDFHRSLNDAHRTAKARVRTGRPWRPRVSEHWTWPIPVATAGGIDRRELSLDVAPGTSALRVSAVNSSELADAQAMDPYQVTVLDADGRQVGTTKKVRGFLAELFVDLRNRPVAFGTWTLRVEGRVASSVLTPGASVGVVASLLREGDAPLPVPEPMELIDTGRVLVADSSGPVGVTRADFEATCSASPVSNGVDGWVTSIPARFGGGGAMLTVVPSGLTLWNVDLHFYDEACNPIGSDLEDGSGGPQDASIPAGSAYVLTVAKATAAVYVADLQIYARGGLTSAG